MRNNNVFLSPVANSVPVDDSTLPLIAPVKTVQDALEALVDLTAQSSKSFTQFSYGGNAISGRYLEFFPGIDTTAAPLRVVGPLKVLAIVARTTNITSICTIEFRDIQAGLPGSLLYTVTFIAQKERIITGSVLSPVFTLPANGQLAIVVGSGSIGKPHLYLTGQGG